MNEKIKELAIISACKNQPLFDSIVRGEYSASSYNKAIEELMEHFAELIVRECARIIDRGNGEVCSMAEWKWCNICRDDILRHFGVDQ